VLAVRGALAHSSYAAYSIRAWLSSALVLSLLSLSLSQFSILTLEMFDPANHLV